MKAKIAISAVAAYLLGNIIWALLNTSYGLAGIVETIPYLFVVTVVNPVFWLSLVCFAVLAYAFLKRGKLFLIVPGYCLLLASGAFNYYVLYGAMKTV